MVDVAVANWSPNPDDELYWLLRAISIERDELYRQLGAARGEADRLRATLRRWHAQHDRCCRRRSTNHGPWHDTRR